MKKLLSLLSFAFILVNIVMAQVPDDVRSNFNTQNPTVTNPEWRTEGDRFRVDYSDNTNRRQSIIYNQDGSVYRMQSELGTDEIPSGISDYYTKNYPSEKNYRVYRETDNAGNATYFGTTGKGNRLLFDNDGRFSRIDEGAGRGQGMNSGTGTDTDSGTKGGTGTKRK